MPQNTSPIFPLTPDIQWARIASGNTAYDGTGQVSTIFSASASGSRLDYVKIRALGVNNSASLMRFYVNNGLTNATAQNNSLFLEYALPTTTSSSTAEASADYTLPFNIALPAAYKLNAALTITLTGSAGSGWQTTAIGGDY
jgi:hypothetical protein